MKAKKSGSKGKPAGKRAAKDLPPRKTQAVKGGGRVKGGDDFIRVVDPISVASAEIR